MNSLSMILRILAVVAAIAAAGLFFVSKGKLAEMQAVAQKAEKATVAVQAELTAANEQISALEGSLKSERDALANEKRKLESMRSEMYTARQEVSRTQQQLSETKKSIDNLENTARRLREDLLRSEQSLASASKEGEIAQLNELVAELEKSNADLKESLEEAKATSSTSRSPEGSANNKMASVDTFSSGYTATKTQALPAASVGAETTIESLSAKNGLIALANSPELGLSPGTTVTIIKKLRALGKIQVSQVSDDLVLANLLPGAKTRELAAGTTVRLLR
jgi:predicted  nucleic acid-binding Zn-ribbon protein